MKWPWTRRGQQEAARREEAKSRLDRIRADWVLIEKAIGPIREGRERNHISERAFALRSRGGHAT